jgi:hypothetical protein
LAVTLIASEPLERYFFRNLARSGDVAWFEPLRERGFFDRPPEPVEREDSSIRYPRWPAVWYLSEIAPQRPEEVVAIAEQIQTRNRLVLLSLVRTATTMPPQCAAEMVPLVVGWANQGMRIGEDVSLLAAYLAQEGQWQAALVLVDLILSPEERHMPEEARESPFFTPAATAKADRYFAQEFVDRELGRLLEHHSTEVLGVVERNLRLALQIEDREDRDLSWIWRPAIEPHEQNQSVGGIKDLLVSAAAQALDAAIKKDVAQARDVLQVYLAQPLSIFRRLAIHTIRENPSRCPDLLELLFTDQRYLEDEAIHHEYWMLMRDTYPALPATIQGVFLDLLLSKLPTGSTENVQ